MFCKGKRNYAIHLYHKINHKKCLIELNYNHGKCLIINGKNHQEYCFLGLKQHFSTEITNIIFLEYNSICSGENHVQYSFTEETLCFKDDKSCLITF